MAIPYAEAARREGVRKMLHAAGIETWHEEHTVEPGLDEHEAEVRGSLIRWLHPEHCECPPVWLIWGTRSVRMAAYAGSDPT